jgi:hypothetical protein
MKIKIISIIAAIFVSSVALASGSIICKEDGDSKKGGSVSSSSSEM